MKKTLVSISLILFSMIALGQNLPENPEPGKCYVRCKTPDTWKNVEVTVKTKDAFKKLVTHPAEYKTITERVLVKEASTRLEVVPAKYETRDVTVVIKEASFRLEVIPGSFDSETITYKAKEDASKLSITPATFRSESELIEIKPATAVWVMSDAVPDCESGNPDDCRYWCYKQVPAEYVTIPQTLINVDAHTQRTAIPGFDKSYKRTVVSEKPTTRRIDIPEETKTIKKTVMVSPPSTRTIEIPPEYATISKVVLVKDAWEEEVLVPAEFQTVVKEVLVEKGGLTSWKEVDCELVEYNPLPINWNLGSSTLTDAAKRIIDTRLLPILKDGVAIELASHTDSRGTKESNQNLSERRAQSVANYLISKGVNPSQLVAKGYGETRLTNRCTDGVTCTEREHLANRRTEFRVINR